MPYATQADLMTRFGERELILLTDPAGAMIVSAVVDRALAAADARVDGFVAGRYAVPLAPVPSVIRDIAGDIARYELHGDRVSERVKEAFDAALKLLKQISAGDFILTGAAPAGGGSQAGGVGPAFERDAPVMSGELAGY